MNVFGSLSLQMLPEDSKDLEIRKTFSKNLRRIMFRRDVSVRELSEKLEVTPSLVSSWRSGKYLPTRYLERLCESLRIQPAELFIDPDNPIFSDMTGDDALEALAQSMGYGIYPIDDKRKK